MSDHNPEERLAVLEMQQKRMHEDIEILHRIFREDAEKDKNERKELMTLVRATIESVGDLRGSVEKHKSFVGGVTFTVSALWVFFIGAWAYFKD